MAPNKRYCMSESATTCEMSCEIADDFKILELNHTPLDISAKFSFRMVQQQFNFSECRQKQGFQFPKNSG